MEFISALGLDYRLLLANIVNFVILLFILKKVAYKPLLAFVQERKKTIADGLKNAELAKTNLAQATTQRETIITQAQQEAQSIIEQAKQQAAQQAASVVAQGQQASAKLMTTAQAEIASERAAALQQAKHEVANLVIMASEKILQQKLDDPTNRAFIERTLTEVKSS